jgi:hypothetical protein
VGAVAVAAGGADAVAGVVRAGVDGAAGIVVCVGTAVGLTVDFSLTTGTTAAGLLVAAAGVDGEEEDEEQAAAAMPMTNTSPQNAMNPVSALCLAAQGCGRCGAPGTPYDVRAGGYCCP